MKRMVFFALLSVLCGAEGAPDSRVSESRAAVLHYIAWASVWLGEELPTSNRLSFELQRYQECDVWLLNEVNRSYAYCPDRNGSRVLASTCPYRGHARLQCLQNPMSTSDSMSIPDLVLGQGRGVSGATEIAPETVVIDRSAIPKWKPSPQSAAKAAILSATKERILGGLVESEVLLSGKCNNFDVKDPMVMVLAEVRTADQTTERRLYWFEINRERPPYSWQFRVAVEPSLSLVQQILDAPIDL